MKSNAIATTSRDPGRKRLSTGARWAAFIGLVAAAVFLASVNLSSVEAATSYTWGTAGSYSVLGGETVTNTGTTTMNRNLGVSPGTAVTGSPQVGPPGTIHAGDSHAAAAQIDNSAAFDFIDQGCTLTYTGAFKDLALENLVPGVYCATQFLLSGTLILSGQGVWIFKTTSDLITSGTANVVSDDPCDVWWRVVSSATLGVGTSFVGNILAYASITIETNALLRGRAFAQTGQVSMDSNRIITTSCSSGSTDTTSPSSTATVTPAAAATQTAAAATATQVAAAAAATQAAARPNLSGLFGPLLTRPAVPQQQQPAPSAAPVIQLPRTGNAGLLPQTTSGPSATGVAFGGVFLLGGVAFALLRTKRRQA